MRFGTKYNMHYLERDKSVCRNLFCLSSFPYKIFEYKVMYSTQEYMYMYVPVYLGQVCAHSLRLGTCPFT